MLNIRTLSLGSYQTNCYIVSAPGNTRCALIDPGDRPEAVLAYLAQEGLSPDAILLTHGHFDHVGAVAALVKATACEVWIHEGDYTQKSTPMTDYLYPLHDKSFCPFQFCEEGQEITAAGLTFRTIETPGHTWGSVCYVCQDTMFCGDTLFAGSCGRTDLPGGDPATMADTLERLGQLDADFRIFPGHGESSTLRHEQRTNPYLRGHL